MAALTFASCNTTRFLKPGEQFLVKNQIKFEKPEGGKLKGKSTLEFELARLYKQKPNRQFFGIKRQFFYYVGQDTTDRSKFGKFINQGARKSLGEEPVLLDTMLTSQTAAAMQAYLQNKGYFFATVESEVTINLKENKATAIYHVQPGGQFKIDTLQFFSKDTAIHRILHGIAGATYLKKGSPIDVKLYQQEVARITQYLRNHGYAYFYQQYVSNLEALDSSNTELSAKLKLEVLTPPGKQAHQLYSVGNIYVYLESDPLTIARIKPDTLIEGIFFASGGKPFKVKPRTLTNSIYLRSGELFSEQNLTNTRNQLGSLGVFDPPSVQVVEDTTHLGLLNFYILLNPNKKWEFGADFDVSTTERKGPVGNTNLIGLSFSPSIRNRNFLRGAELFIGNANAGVELAPFSGRQDLINSLDFRLQGDLYFPRFADYFKLWRGLRGVTGAKFYETMRQKATSRFSSSYNLLVLLDNYRLQFVNVSYGFDIPLNLHKRLIINHFGIDFIVPNIIEGSRFDSVLQQQPFLQNSFKTQFITGLLFRDLNYIYTSPATPSGSSWFFKGAFDVSGLEVWAANATYNAVSGQSPDFKLFKEDFSHYAKMELEGRRYWQFSPHRLLAARLSAGIARPYYHSESVPYVKQFFVGGPNSIRAWYARGLGPGLYRDPLTDSPGSRNLFYQAADFKMEFNLEYRFLLMRPLNLFNLYGAVFLDGGNIWTLEKDPNRIGSQLALRREIKDDIIVQDNFLREFAIGTGFGSRWDFTYFIFRLDLGLPLRNNFPDPERGNRYWRDVSKLRLNDLVLNLGLGYPF